MSRSVKREDAPEHYVAMTYAVAQALSEQLVELDFLAMLADGGNNVEGDGKGAAAILE